MKITYYDGIGIPVVFLTDREIPEITNPILAVTDFDWNNDLSPWPAPAAFRNTPAFAGNADVFLEDLLQQLPNIPLCIAGYSLAGLFALYACTKTDRFTGCASVSGSLWYPGFEDYLKEHPVHCPHVYLSLGDTECKTKNPYMSEVGVCTKEIYALLDSYTDTVFESNPGNHFHDPVGRVIKSIARLNRQCRD